MAKLSTMGGTLTKHTQMFLASGTFTPSQRLLDLGGRVELDLRGGGGAGAYGYYTTGTAGAGGGSSKWLTDYIVTGPTTVTIGSGGSTNSGYGAVAVFGGSSTFGIKTCPGAQGGHGILAQGSHSANAQGGAGGGPDGQPGHSPQSGSNGTANYYATGGNGGGNGAGNGMNQSGNGYGLQIAPSANSGAGGGSWNTGAGSAILAKGADGMCLVTWWE